MSNAKRIAQVICALLLLLGCFLPAFAQQNVKEHSSYSNPYIIAPKTMELSSDLTTGLTSQSFSSSTKGMVIYAPENEQESSLSLFIDRKSEQGVERTSYDFESYFSERKDPDDINKGPSYITRPQLSQDGSRIIFKHLVYDQYYQIFSLNLRSNQFFRIFSKLIAYSFVSISPNGRYVAFVEGGDTTGNVYRSILGQQDYTGPLELFVADLESGNQYSVNQSDYINGSLQWISNSTLIYGTAAKSNKDEGAQLNIYEFNVDTNKSNLLAENGVMPHPSGDGKSIAFFGPSDQNMKIEWSGSWRQKPPSGVSLLNQNEKSRVAFEPAGRRYPELSWLSDNTQFISLRESTSDLNAMVQLRLWNVKTQDTRLVTELKTRDNLKTPKGLLSSRFHIIKTDSNGILISESDILRYRENGLGVDVQNSVYSVNIASGEVKQELTAENVLSLGYDIRLVQQTEK